MKGQLSAEMIILVVVILAIVAIVASSLISSAKQTSSAVTTTTTTITAHLNYTCITDDDCKEILGKPVCKLGECNEK
ncbi:MAG: hypothetical protein NTY68_02835 [Candidatus Micrarchaeota archaeon]|nr:hypothetical protein [Candidatus Micrarchaeota archaeon]